MFIEKTPPPENQLKPHATFRFSCHKGLSCFNICCSNKHLPLTPYDVLGLKTSLELHSDDFLSKYTVFRVDPASGFPIISIAMGDDPQKTCPFVSDSGCTVYEHRPTACRLYPLGRSSGGEKALTGGWKEIFSLLDTPNCLGRREERELRVEDWCKEQGLGPYLKHNDMMLDILFHPGRKAGSPLNDGQLQKIMVAVYNLDVFRDFVFQTDFLKRFEVDSETQSNIKNDDSALLKMGFAYLRKVLYLY